MEACATCGKDTEDAFLAAKQPFCGTTQGKTSPPRTCCAHQRRTFPSPWAAVTSGAYTCAKEVSSDQGRDKRTRRKLRQCQEKG